MDILFSTFSNQDAEDEDEHIPVCTKRRLQTPHLLAPPVLARGGRLVFESDAYRALWLFIQNTIFEKFTK